MTDHITAIKGHGYKTEIFKLRELIDLELQLGKIMGGVSGPGIDYLWGLFSLDKTGLHLRNDPDKSTDPAKLGKAIAAIPGGIIAEGGYDFIKHILSQTSREVDLGADGDLSFARLSSPYPGDGAGTWMEHIYPGNLAELHMAVLWVLCVNFSPFGREPSWSLSQLWDELLTRIPEAVMTMAGTASDGSDETKTPTD